MKFYIIIILLFISTSCLAQKETTIKTYSKDQLLSDYDLVVSSLKEGHPGLYWYTSFVEYEKIFKENRAKIEDGMNAYEFYRIISKIVTADREGHSSVYRPHNVSIYTENKAKLLPTLIKIIFDHQSKWSDGYTTTGKYYNIEYFNFSFKYHYFIDDFKSDVINIELQNPKTNEISNYNVSLISRDEILKIIKKTPYVYLKNENKLFNLEYKPEQKTSILTFNDFGYSSYEKKNTTFKKVVDSLFSIIKKNKTKNLIIAKYRWQNFT